MFAPLYSMMNFYTVKRGSQSSQQHEIDNTMIGYLDKYKTYCDVNAE